MSVESALYNEGSACSIAGGEKRIIDKRAIFDCSPRPSKKT